MSIMDIANTVFRVIMGTLHMVLGIMLGLAGTAIFLMGIVVLFVALFAAMVRLTT